MPHGGNRTTLKSKLRNITICILIAVFLNLIYLKAAHSHVDAQNIQILLTTGSSLSFQNDLNSNLTLQVTKGVLNSSENKLRFDSGGGEFQFTALNDAQIKIISDCVVKVKGDQGNEFRPIDSGSILYIDAGDSVLIQWDRQIEPLLPMMFIFGMVGLGAMIGGPLYAINKFKKREYLEGFRTGIVVTVIGVALFIAWLW